MRLSRGNRSEPVMENTLPMINIVFLLLIFFMIAGSLQNSLPFDMDPLTAAGDLRHGDPPAVIHLSRDGEISFQDRLFSLEKLEQALTALASGDAPVPPIQIKSDRAANSVTVIRILSQLRTLGVEKVTLAVVE